jgi:hypothetical protein
MCQGQVRPSGAAALRSTSHQLRQLGDVRRDPACLVARKPSAAYGTAATASHASDLDPISGGEIPPKRGFDHIGLRVHEAGDRIFIFGRRVTDVAFVRVHAARSGATVSEQIRIRAVSRTNSFQTGSGRGRCHQIATTAQLASRTQKALLLHCCYSLTESLGVVSTLGRVVVPRYSFVLRGTVRKGDDAPILSKDVILPSDARMRSACSRNFKRRTATTIRE